MTPDYAGRAACLDADPELFFSERPDDITAAKRGFCANCPIQGRCLADAMVNEEEYGIWGGHTPAERKRRSFRQEWERLNGDRLDLLRTVYKRNQPVLDWRHDQRLHRAKICRRRISPAMPRYDDYRTVLDMVISAPDAPSEKLAFRIGKSASFVRHLLLEVWELVS